MLNLSKLNNSYMTCAARKYCSNNFVLFLYNMLSVECRLCSNFHDIVWRQTLWSLHDNFISVSRLLHCDSL